MRKLFARLLIGLLLLIPISPARAYSQAPAETYLLAHSDNPWSTMALSVLNSSSIPTDHLKAVTGTSAIEYAAPILAIAALNQNPRTFGSGDYVAALKSYYSNNQIGDPATLNDDIFGILALVSAGEPLNDPVIAGAKKFLLSLQHSDGGWGFATTSSSDTNMTASAILALLAAGSRATDSHIQNALNYLQGAQNSDGGFPYDPQSSFGTASDSSSTSWVIWALNALNIDPATWNKGGQTLISYLESTQSSAGYFQYQPGSGEDSFSPITTSYAVIALEDRFLPLQTFSPAAGAKFPFRIEGSTENVCEGEAAGPTAMDIVKNASLICGFTYVIQNTAYGPYLSQINSDAASGLQGWLYLVNNISPDIGAADYVLQVGDSVLWYYGEFGWTPTRLGLSAAEVPDGQSVTATVEAFQNSAWTALPEAIVFFGVYSAATNSIGQAQLSAPAAFYQVFAEKTGYIRSNQVLLQIGNPVSTTVNLQVTFEPGGVAGETTPPPTGTIAFEVTPSDLDFGTLGPGTVANKNITVKNLGSTKIHVESIVEGDTLFVDLLKISGLLWKNFQTSLEQSQNQDHTVGLTIPQGYSTLAGVKNGDLIFWAQAE